MRRASPRSLALAAFVLLALSGCATGGADAAPSSSAEAPSEPPVETPAAVLPQPVVSIGVDCEGFRADDDLAGVLGAPVSRSTSLAEQVWAVGVLGGLACSWHSADDTASLSLTIVPADGLDAAIAADDDEPWCYGGADAGGVEGRCSFGEVVDRYWVTGVLGVAPGHSGGAPEGIDDVLARVAELASAAPASATVRPAMMWSHGLDCATVVPMLESVLGGVWRAAEGNGLGEAPSGIMASYDAVGGAACNWTDEADASGGRWLSGATLPGAGWAVGEVAAREGARQVEVDGAVLAVASGDADGADTLYATDGVNLAWVLGPQGGDEAERYAALAELLRAAAV